MSFASNAFRKPRGIFAIEQCKFQRLNQHFKILPRRIFGQSLRKSMEFFVQLCVQKLGVIIHKIYSKSLFIKIIHDVLNCIIEWL